MTYDTWVIVCMITTELLILGVTLRSQLGNLIGDHTKENRQQFAQLTHEEPQRWALLLEKYFAIRKNEEGVMLTQAIGKLLLKKRTRRTKKELEDARNAQSERFNHNHIGQSEVDGGQASIDS